MPSREYEKKLAASKCYSPTLAENIEQRIVSMKGQIERLERVKALLSTGNMLDVPIDDLRFAMNY